MTSPFCYIEAESPKIRPNHHLGDTPDLAQGDPLLDLILPLLPITLRIGFRLIAPGQNLELCDLNHTPHHNWVFETAFSSDVDDIIADAVCAWAAPAGCAPFGSCARYFTKRVESDTPFSPRLRRMAILAVERSWRSELEVLGFETVNLLNRLGVDMDDMVDGGGWAQLLAAVICSPTGFKGLSSHYWRLLDKLVLNGHEALPSPPNVEVMKFLEEAEDWERLEIWMSAVWTSHTPCGSSMDKPMEDIERSTLRLFSRRPSALLRFQSLPAHWPTNMQPGANGTTVFGVCFYSSPPAPIDSHAAFFICFSEPNQLVRAQPPILLPFVGDDTF